MYGENTKTIAIPIYIQGTTVPCDDTSPILSQIYILMVEWILRFHIFKPVKYTCREGRQLCVVIVWCDNIGLVSLIYLGLGIHFQTGQVHAERVVSFVL